MQCISVVNGEAMQRFDIIRGLPNHKMGDAALCVGADTKPSRFTELESLSGWGDIAATKLKAGDVRVGGP